MKITINGTNADIKPDTEKTVGDVLCVLEPWLADSGFRLSGLGINGETMGTGSMEACFARGIDTIDTLDLRTSSLPELIAECLFHILQDITAFEATAFEERRPFAESWKESPEAHLLAEQSPDLFEWTLRTFSGDGPNPQMLRALVEERLRELQDPAGEMRRTAPLVSEVCARLEEFPLDMQTGKDIRAAETVNAFSSVAEKVFRVFNVLKMEGFPVTDIMVEETPISVCITEFNNALRELVVAYEQNDTVLAGDIAEYEMSPRLRGLHSAVINAIIGE